MGRKLTDTGSGKHRDQHALKLTAFFLPFLLLFLFYYFGFSRIFQDFFRDFSRIKKYEKWESQQDPINFDQSQSKLIRRL